MKPRQEANARRHRENILLYSSPTVCLSQHCWCPLEKSGVDHRDIQYIDRLDAVAAKKPFMNVLRIAPFGAFALG